MIRGEAWEKDQRAYFERRMRSDAARYGGAGDPDYGPDCEYGGESVPVDCEIGRMVDEIFSGSDSR